MTWWLGSSWSSSSSSRDRGRPSLPIQSDRMGTGHPHWPWTLAGRGWSSTEASPHARCLGGVRFHPRVAATWTPVNGPGGAWRRRRRRPANRGHRRRPGCSFLDAVRHGGTRVVYMWKCYPGRHERGRESYLGVSLCRPVAGAAGWDGTAAMPWRAGRRIDGNRGWSETDGRR
jgi:hypothetical protein